MVPAMLPRSQDEAQIQRPPQRQRGGKGSSGKRFFKRKKGRRKADQILPTIRQMLGNQMDNGKTVNGRISTGMTGPGTSLRSPTQPKEKERKVRRAKERASVAKMEKTESLARMDKPNLQFLPRAARQLPQPFSLNMSTR